MTSTFVSTLKRLLADPALVTKNTILDPTLLALYLARVDALTPDVLRWFTAGDVLVTGADAPKGALTPDVARNEIALDTDGFEVTFSRFRDGLASSPLKIRRRYPTDLAVPLAADRAQYLLADTTHGVLLLDANMEVVRTFPGLTNTVPLSGATYTDARSAVTATIGSTELMFVACGGQHCVKVFNYATGALVSTIGTAGTAGIPTAVPARLDTPVALAVDEVNNRLFIACAQGDPTGSDSTDAGFVSEWDIAAPAVPVFVNTVLMGNELYRLNHSQCKAPCDLFFEPAKLTLPTQDARLWVANGLGDVGAFTRTAVTDTWVPTLVIPAQGRGYVLGPDTVASAALFPVTNAIDLFTGTDGNTRLYVAAQRTGVVEVFRASSTQAGYPLGSHEATYGHRGIEDTAPYGGPLRVHSTPQEPPLTYGVFTTPTGVVADEQRSPSESVTTSLLLVADQQAGRIQRLRLPFYSTESVVTFLPFINSAPVMIGGWFLPADATFPAEFLTLEVRDPGDITLSPVAPPTAWREVPRAGFSTPVHGPEYTRYQFRLRARVPRDAPVRAYATGAVGILLRQTW